MPRLFLVGFLFLLSNISGNGLNSSMPIDVIQIQASTRFSTISGLIQAQHFYSKYQSMFGFILKSPSSTFIKIPGLTFAFSHTTPLLYKIRFQGSCETGPVSHVWSFLRIMIDDKILVSNRLLPNNDQRALAMPSLGANLIDIDSRGGISIFSTAAWLFTPCAKSDNVYLPAGTHSIDVVVRTGQQVHVFGGELNVELMQYNSDSSINLPIMNTQANG
jgi:hypothetical protein